MKVFCKGCGKELYDMDEIEYIITPYNLKKHKLKSDRCKYCNVLLSDKFTIKENNLDES